MTYRAPVDDILLALKTAGGLPAMIDKDLLAGLDEDTIKSVIEEAAKFGGDVLAPLNRVGDAEGCKLEGDKVTTPKGWKAAYEQFIAAGWSTLPCDEAHGGQGLPEVVSMAVGEIWNAANLAFGLCPLLTQGAIDAVTAHGSDELKRIYLGKMVSGEWSGTMNLTEPQAGSDVGALRSKAIAQGDGTYRIHGTKIFITYGEHDMTDNIIHLVLARLPDAPAGTRGISLFLVPKFLVNEDGTLGARNDVKCVGLEHKLGIHASPTCVMAYGEGEGAIGYLIGEENRGLNTMFIMMNQARLAVGVQGVAIAERATQAAIAYANERKQGSKLGDKSGAMTEIINHADVRRNIMTMKAMTQGARAICMATAGQLDMSHLAKDEGERAQAAALAALLTPIAKAFSTDIGCEVASIGVQVHGGMGFIEETGAAQYMRDARILPIYEGTNGIQAMDLVARKLPLEGGKTVQKLIGEFKQTVAELGASNLPAFGKTAERLDGCIDALIGASAYMGKTLPTNPEAALAGATPYLRLFGLAAGGSYLARGALAAVRDGGGSGSAEQVALARFFAENLCSGGAGLAASVIDGADGVLSLSPAQLG